jgi:histidine triad (HIT) family protein
MKKLFLISGLLFFYLFVVAQSPAYQQKKAQQLSDRSPFQDEIDGKFPDHILYQDDDVIAFNSIAPQMPIHVLIIPKRRIPTINDLTEKDSVLLAKMLFSAQKLAKTMGIAETGYRLSINTNENAGQSVFHIHMHLLGGHKTGAMVEQTWRNRSDKPSPSYLKDIENIKNSFGDYFTAWLKNDTTTILNHFTPNAVIMPQGLKPKQGLFEIRQFWFPKDGSKTIITQFDYIIEELKLDLNTAMVRGSSVLSFAYEKDGQKTVKTGQKQMHTTFFERQVDNTWRVSCKMWGNTE